MTLESRGCTLNLWSREIARRVEEVRGRDLGRGDFAETLGSHTGFSGSTTDELGRGRDEVEVRELRRDSVGRLIKWG